MKIYRIKDWHKTFELSDCRKVDGPLKWVPVRTATDGYGFCRIAQERNRCELLAAWYLMVALCARQPKESRGTLARDGRPITPEEMQMVTRFPAEVFERAMAYFSSPEIGWLIPEGESQAESEPVRTRPDESGAIRTDSDASGRLRTRSATLHTLQDKTGVCAAVAAPQSDSEWIAELKANPTYRGIDVEREFGKMNVWCRANRKQANRRRFINWLNKCDRPIGIGSQPSTEAETEPEGWRAYWRTKYPPEDFPDAPRYDEGEWRDVRNDHKRDIRAGMKREGALHT